MVFSVTDLAKFRHFGNILKLLEYFYRVYFVFGKILNILWVIFYAIGQILIVVNGKVLNKSSSQLVTLVVVQIYKCSGFMSGKQFKISVT